MRIINPYLTNGKENTREIQDVKIFGECKMPTISNEALREEFELFESDINEDFLTKCEYFEL